LFGSDVNRNGVLDPQETGSLAGAAGLADPNDPLVLGWARYLTLYSVETNLREDGTAKIDVNSSDLKQLHSDLQSAFDEETATFVVAYRQNANPGNQAQPQSGRQAGGEENAGDEGADSQNGSPNVNRAVEPAEQNTGQASAGQTPAVQGKVTLDFTKPGNQRIESVLDLIGKDVTIPPATPGQPPQMLKSPFPNERGAMAEYLPRLTENVTTSTAKTITGRLNINQAPEVVLMAVPEMTVKLASDIVATRDPESSLPKPGRRDGTWILAEGLVTLEQMRTMMPFVTASGSTYRAQVVGYFDAGGLAARIEIVLDATTSPPRLVFWRDMSPLGPGFAMKNNTH
jgi:DNA uptake protein ComE-like DNA-binding protein